MKRKDDGNSVISLFSFQDIITSITGIMFLVVLLLVLIMLSSRQPSASQTRSAPQEHAQQLARLEELKQRLAELQSSSRSMQEELENLRNMSPDEIARRKDQLQAMILQQRNTQKTLQQQLQLSEAQLIKMQNTVQLNNKLIRDQQKKIDQLKSEQQKLQKELNTRKTILERNKNLVEYTISASNNKIPILIEVDENGFQMLRLDNNERKDFRQPGRIHTSMLDLLRHISSVQSYNNYFTIVAKPNGFAHAMRLSYELKKKNFERGIEILPGNSSTIFEENIYETPDKK